MAWPASYFSPAKGASVHGDAAGPQERGERAAAFSADNQPDLDVIAAGKQRKAEMRAFFETKRMAAAKKIVSIIEMTDNGTLQLAAANSLLDRLDGKPVQAVSGPDGEALPNVMNVRFVSPA